MPAGRFPSPAVVCPLCTKGQDNLCINTAYPGHQVFGGYAEYISRSQHAVLAIPENVGYEAAAATLWAVFGWAAGSRFWVPPSTNRAPISGRAARRSSPANLTGRRCNTGLGGVVDGCSLAARSWLQSDLDQQWWHSVRGSAPSGTHPSSRSSRYDPRDPLRAARMARERGTGVPGGAVDRSCGTGFSLEPAPSVEGDHSRGAGAKA
ncbi:alcohol dehydrogenase catalytic domain-containing protein [Actinomadura rayongensis]|uniref:Alcohol dehydrogenase catalytic domain-containing protein n=1 Tax=Actinomadura rayongensis TaxID=1429076 RepID=A0A6I4W9L8_9ACTN|nr:alcohol dehydrogenase catalytic domain-containing protein [Actinomadura rayongensis]